MIPYGRQEVTEDDIARVVAVLRSDFITQGQQTARFEEAIAAYCGAKHAVAACNATAALHLACRALSLGPGDWLWTSPITFVASSNCALYCGAKVDFVDIDDATANLCPKSLAEKLALAEVAGRLPKVVVAVHLAGQSCDMLEISRLGKRYGFKIIEDASHAIGAEAEGCKVGACKHSDITVFSFHPVKIITTAEGGCATTNQPLLADRMRLLRSHGISRDIEKMVKPSDEAWYYEQLELGYNYRMTEMQAALGLGQLQRLDGYVERRNTLASRYDIGLKLLPMRLPWQCRNGRSAFHLYVVRLKLEEIQLTRQDVFARMRASGIGVNLHYIPVHLQPYYAKFGFMPGDYPVAEAYYREAISLPLYPTLSESDQDSVILTVAKLLSM